MYMYMHVEYMHQHGVHAVMHGRKAVNQVGYYVHLVVNRLDMQLDMHINTCTCTLSTWDVQVYMYACIKIILLGWGIQQDRW